MTESAEDYGPVLAGLISPAPSMPLDVGSANVQAGGRLSGATLDAAFAHVELVDRDLGACCLAGAWLLHGYLDEAHTICQDVAQASGSYWHGVVHRREGDYGNARYWFSRAGSHPGLEPLVAVAAADPLTERLADGGDWDAGGFVDLCRTAVSGQDAALRQACVELQLAEWRALFDWCYQNAVR